MSNIKTTIDAEEDFITDEGSRKAQQRSAQLPKTKFAEREEKLVATFQTRLSAPKSHIESAQKLQVQDLWESSGLPTPSVNNINTKSSLANALTHSSINPPESEVSASYTKVARARKYIDRVRSFISRYRVTRLNRIKPDNSAVAQRTHADTALDVNKRKHAKLLLNQQRNQLLKQFHELTHYFKDFNSSKDVLQNDAATADPQRSAILRNYLGQVKHRGRLVNLHFDSLPLKAEQRRGNSFRGRLTNEYNLPMLSYHNNSVLNNKLEASNAAKKRAPRRWKVAERWNKSG